MKSTIISAFCISAFFCTLTFHASPGNKTYRWPAYGCSEPNPGPAETVTLFLKWYKQNYDAVNSPNMVDFPETDDPGLFYRVNFEGTEEYLNLLKSSGYISDTYIETWRDYFKKCDDNFLTSKQNDGPPDGFEFDFVLWTQEIEGSLEAIDAIVITNTNETGNTCYVEVDISMRLGFYLSKIKGIWLIDAIENMGY